MTYTDISWGANSSGTWDNSTPPTTCRTSGSSWEGYNAGDSITDTTLKLKAKFTSADAVNTYGQIGFSDTLSSSSANWYLYFGKTNQWVRLYDADAGSNWTVTTSYSPSDEFELEITTAHIKTYMNGSLVNDITSGFTPPATSTAYYPIYHVEHNDDYMWGQVTDTTPTPTTTSTRLPPPPIILGGL